MLRFAPAPAVATPPVAPTPLTVWAAVGGMRTYGWTGLIADVIIRRRGNIPSVGDILRSLSAGTAP